MQYGIWTFFAEYASHRIFYSIIEERYIIFLEQIHAQAQKMHLKIWSHESYAFQNSYLPFYLKGGKNTYIERERYREQGRKTSIDTQ